MKNKLLIKSKTSGNWCVYYRPADLIPTMVLIYADVIYNYDTRFYIKNTQGNIIPDNISNLPVAENIISPLGFVCGIKFGDEYIGKRYKTEGKPFPALFTD